MRARETTSVPSSVRAHPGGLGSLNGRPVARIGYGAMRVASGDEASAHALLRRAVERGVDHIDTAQFYDAGRVNERIRTALHPYPQHLMLVSKIGATSDPHAAYGLRPAQRPAELRAEVEANLRTLHLEHLDLVNFYPMRRTQGISDEQRVDFDDQLAELLALRDAGMIGGFGLSHIDEDDLRHALPAGIACVQNGYNVLDRSAEPVLLVCREHDIPWVPHSPLGAGFASPPRVIDHAVVKDVATRVAATPAQVGLAWILTRSAQAMLIPGTNDLARLDENLAAGDVELDHESLRLLEGAPESPTDVPRR